MKPEAEVLQKPSSPERLPVDANLVEDVFEKLGRALLDHVLDPQTGFQILQKPLQKADEVLCCSNGTGHRLWQKGGGDKHGNIYIYIKMEKHVWCLGEPTAGGLPWRISSGNTGFER